MMNNSSPSLANKAGSVYRLPVTANSVTGFSGPENIRRTSAPVPTAGAFFVPATSRYGGCAWETERSAGFRVSRSANLRTVATLNRLAAIGGGSPTHGATPMKLFPTRNPSSRAAAHRAMARAALRSESSLSVRLRRYNQHMTKARALEALGRAMHDTRSAVYAAIAAGELVSFKSGKRRLILVKELEAWLNRLAKENNR